MFLLNSDPKAIAQLLFPVKTLMPTIDCILSSIKSHLGWSSNLEMSVDRRPGFQPVEDAL